MSELEQAQDSRETCPVCDGDSGDNWFDRSLCACDAMHTCCRNCGHALDGCPYDTPETIAADRERKDWASAVRFWGDQ